MLIKLHVCSGVARIYITGGIDRPRQAKSRSQRAEVIIKNTSRNTLSDLKHEVIAKCSGSDKARTICLLNDFKHEPLNTLTREDSLTVF